MSEITSLPNLSWEEITKNIEQMKQANSKSATAIKNAYLEEIQHVNDALQRGATIAIRVAAHDFTCLPGELHPIGGSVEKGCLLQIRKVVVEFRQDEQTLTSRITLRFWDTSHEQEVVWGATTVQPQWESIVQQAQNMGEKWN